MVSHGDQELQLTPVGSGQLIQSAIAIQHKPVKPLNPSPYLKRLRMLIGTKTLLGLKKTIYSYPRKNSHLTQGNAPTWYVVDATETGEIIALADVPYRLGIDARSYLDHLLLAPRRSILHPGLYLYICAGGNRNRARIKCLHFILGILNIIVMNCHDKLSLNFHLPPHLGPDTGKPSEFSGIKFTALNTRRHPAELDLGQRLPTRHRCR